MDAAPEIADALWQSKLYSYPFLQYLTAPEHNQLQALSAHFLQRKQLPGTHDLTITDQMALSVAAQACVRHSIV